MNKTVVLQRFLSYRGSGYQGAPLYKEHFLSLWTFSLIFQYFFVFLCLQLSYNCINWFLSAELSVSNKLTKLNRAKMKGELSRF